MMRRILLPFIPVLLLMSFYQFNPQRFSDEPGAFGLPTVYATSALTRQTSQLPPVVFIQAEPSLSPEVEQYLVKGIHFLYKFYLVQFDYAFPADLTVVIRVFRDRDEYKAYTSRVATSPIADHIGLYIHDRREIVVWQRDNTVLFTKTVFHETSHLLLRSQNRFCPRWLSEGLSEYFEELDLSNELPVVHPQLRKDQYLKRRQLAGKLPALGAYLARTDREWARMDNSSAATRTLAWSLVYFLMDCQQGQQLLKELLIYYQSQLMDPFLWAPLVNSLIGPGAFAPPGSERIVRLEKKWHHWLAQQRADQQIMLRPPDQNLVASIGTN